MTSGDDVVPSSGPSVRSLAVPAVKEPRHSTVEFQGLDEASSLQQATRDTHVGASDVEADDIEVVTKLVSNVIMKPGAFRPPSDYNTDNYSCRGVTTVISCVYILVYCISVCLVCLFFILLTYLILC